MNDDLSSLIGLRDRAYWQHIYAAWAQQAIKNSSDVVTFYRLDRERCAALRHLLIYNFQIATLLRERQN